jgi:DNA-binding CsgD family transcriptional regulator
MGHAEASDPWRGILSRVFQGTVRFEIQGQGFLAVPQVEWCATEADRSEIRFLHRHVAGRLRIGAQRYVVFATADTDELPDTGASVAEILTRRELQVAMLVADGKADKEIARHLGISEHTVREHLRRACAKLNISKRSALVAWVMRSPSAASS